MKKKVAVGLSGGVDSSVAAYFLKKENLDVVGFTLKFYPQENRCCDLDSLDQAKRLCHKLDIPHYVIDAGSLFKKEIIDYFVESYSKGLTPNPCAYCNRLIKFGFFIDKIKSLGIKYISTGHYAKLIKRNGKVFIKTNKDKRKSQEYFLSLLKPDILKDIIFPLGNYSKEQVKKIAKDNKIIFKEREESQDICFVKDGPYHEFIAKSLKGSKNLSGIIKHIDGKILGEHKGIYRYTYGQRSGLGISWPKPLYVVAIREGDNSVIVAEKERLYKDNFSVNSLNWLLNPYEYSQIKVKVRYNSAPIGCKIKGSKKRLQVSLDQGIDTVAPGQVAAFYHKDILLGGGIIEKDRFCQ